MNIFVPTAESRQAGTRRRRRSTAVTGLLALALSVAGLVPMATPAVADSLASVGPVDNATGFPFWFGDGGDADKGLAPLRLELCLDQEQDPLCPVVGDRPNPGAPLSVPENFPDESFWWSADALIDTGGVKARLVLGQEAAFGGVGAVAVDQQVSFSRLRIRIDGLRPSTTYHVTTPYGTRDVVTSDRGRAFDTDDQGCLSPPCGFEANLHGQVGPFLRWDSDAPEGYVGDPAVEHTVVGSPTGDNFFRVEGPDAGGPGVDSIETDLFTVQGRIARPRGTVDLPGDLYAAETPVQIMPSFPGESEVVYTTDGTDPLTSDTATVHQSTNDEPAATVTLPTEAGPMTLKYAVRSGGQTSEVYTEDYTVRADLPVVTATPGPAKAPDVLEGRQDVVLSATTNGVPTPGKIYYTTDGTRPRLDEAGDPLGSTREYADPITITRKTLVRAFSLPDPSDSVPAPEPGPVARFQYQLHNLRAVSSDQPFGYPFTLTDIGLPAATPGEPRVDPMELELCLDDPMCPVVGDLPDPTRGVSFPGNFPDESFWWSGDAAFTAGGVDARLVLGVEAAFDTGAVKDGHQIAFGRIRVDLRGAVPGATYEIVHPYGVVRATAADTGRLFYTDDNGCMTGPCGFDRLLTQPVGPFLRWDSGAPEGYVGDPTIEHTVTGSPLGTNEFTVRQVTDGDGQPISPELVGSTDLFTVQGKLAGPGVMADYQTGTFTHPLQVRLTGNALTSQIRYTLDGSIPTADTGLVYDGPIDVGEGTTTLNYLAVGQGRTSMVEAETYTVDSTPPTLDASPAGGSFGSAQSVSLSTDDATAIVRYTLDGSDPAGGTVYDGSPVSVDRSLTLRAVATDPAGNATTRSWDFTITPPPPGGAQPATPGFSLQRLSATAVSPGGATALNGVLAPNGQALAGARVLLQARAVTTAGVAVSAWSTVATATTTGAGRFAFTGLRPQLTTEFRAVFSDPATGAIVSPARRVDVRAVLSLAQPATRVARGRKVTFRGTLGPTTPGTAVVVRLAGPGPLARQVRATVTRTGAWSVTVRAPRRTGRWTAVASWAGNSRVLAGRSAGKAFRVVR